MRKIIFVLFLLLCVVFVSAATDFELELTKTAYSTNENFKGNILIDYDSVDISKVASADISECGAYDAKEIKLYNLLYSAGIYTGSEFDYTLGQSSLKVEESFSPNETKLIGIYVNDELDELNLSISGVGSGFYVDVGDDGVDDWHYLGDFSGWGLPLESNEYDTSYDINHVTDFNPQYGACNYFEINFDELSNKLKLQVNAMVKRTVEEGEIFAEIGSSECNLTPSTQNVFRGMTCELELDVEGYESPHTFRLCLDSTQQGYWLPNPAGSDYYFFNVKKAEYDEGLTSQKVYLDDSALLNSINDYTNDCSSGDCVVPLSLRLVNAGNVVLDDLFLKYGQSQAYDFYEIDSEPVLLDLTNRSVSLDSFTPLKTPDLDEADTCILTITFDGTEQEAAFNVSPGPVAIIEVSSLYNAKDLDITFDGSESYTQNNGSIDKWTWDFGDNKTASGEVVKHKYNNEGNYTVILTVEDEEGFEAEDSVDIYIVDLEEYLDSEFTRVNNLFTNAESFVSGLSGDLAMFSNFMGYEDLIATNKELVEDLEANFTSLKESNATGSQYSRLANDLHSVLIQTPASFEIEGKENVQNLQLTSPSDVFSFSGISNVSNFNDYANAIYTFNQNNVNVDMNAILFDVEFFEGSSNYVYVKKTVNIDGGSNNIIVEDIRNLVSNLDSVVSDARKDETKKVIYWNADSSTELIEYVVETNNLEEIKTIVYSDVDTSGSGGVYCYISVSNCERYCGDGHCDIISYLEVDEKDDLNENYCPQDCVRETPILKYVILFVVFLILIVYLFLYKGPGNIKSIGNKLSYALFHKKLFMSERDKTILVNFISNSFRRGFRQEQIKSALVKKGWNNKQIDYVMESYINKKK